MAHRSVYQPPKPTNDCCWTRCLATTNCLPATTKLKRPGKSSRASWTVGLPAKLRGSRSTLLGVGGRKRLTNGSSGMGVIGGVCKGISRWSVIMSDAKMRDAMSITTGDMMPINVVGNQINELWGQVAGED